MIERDEIRLALPSKGVLMEPTLELLTSAGLGVFKPNPRQYRAEIPNLPGVAVFFQRPGDIVVGVREASMDFGITGWDVAAERGGNDGNLLVIHPSLGFGHCTLNVIVPENWEDTKTLADLKTRQSSFDRPLRIATQFPNLTQAFFDRHHFDRIELIAAEGTLEIAPSIGYADLITDLVASGTTLRDNRLKKLDDGLILASQSCLIANRQRLKENPAVLATAKVLLEFIVAHLRARENVSVFANMRGETPEEIAHRMFAQDLIGGLQGPTLSPVITRQGDKWFAAHLVVHKDQLVQAIAEIRQVGGSGVVVAPVTYIFEEEPHEYQAMLAQIKD